MALPRRIGRAALVLVASAFAASSPLEAQRAHRDNLPAPEVKKLELTGLSGVVPADEIQRNIAT
ncbi:MAG: hypothetical protein JOZ69_08495, partial [Myxococcales bacterium]|nr:hypothetical protein [Myxococcales bacterium]